MINSDSFYRAPPPLPPKKKEKQNTFKNIMHVENNNYP